MVLARGTLVIRAGETRRVTIAIGRNRMRLLRRHKRISSTVHVTLQAPDGQKTSASKTLRLSLPRR